jgi:tetratricopeptide (TPR) repeat protein
MNTIRSLIGKHWYKTVLLLVILVFSCNNSDSDSNYIAENYVSVGIAHYKNGDNYLAITAWKQALELIPGDAELHNFIGIAYHKLNALDSAIAHFKRATELDDDYYQAYNNLGYAYFIQKDYTDAEVCFESSVLKKPNYAPAIANLKKIRDIIEHLKQAENLTVRQSNENYTTQKIKIAVLNLNPKNISKDIASAVTLRLRSEISSLGYYHLLESEEMNEICKEQGFQLSGCTSSECMVDAGKVLNVEQIIGGSITSVGKNYIIKLRLINIETGKVVAVATEKMKGHSENVLSRGIKKVAQKLSNFSKV